MNRAKPKLPLVAIAVLFLASYVVFLEVEANEDSDEQIGASAIWNPAPGELLQVEQNCGSVGRDYSRCFIEQMSNFDAPLDAVAFTQTYSDQNHGSIALLASFHPMDTVDLGEVSFPGGRGGVHQGWVLLNGTPAIINVDDLDLLPGSEMLNDAAYNAVRRRHAKVALFAGERAPAAAPAAETLPDGGQQFTIDYPLRDGCADCATLGRAAFRFDFDPAGKFIGVKFVAVTAEER